MKILFLDIETSPNLGYTWGKWEQNVISFVKEWELLSFAYKWAGEDTVTCITRLDAKGVTDKKLTKALHEVLNEADVVVAHNGDSFDIKKSKTRFLKHGLPPTKPFKSIDTKKVAKRAFGLNSNSLNDIAKFLGLGQKLKHDGFEMWEACMKGNKRAFALMAKYNKQDVLLLEKVYKKLLPWTNHPSQPSGLTCQRCKSPHLQSRGQQVSATGTYQRFQCQDCGGWCRSRLAVKGAPKSDVVNL